MADDPAKAKDPEQASKRATVMIGLIAACLFVLGSLAVLAFLSAEVIKQSGQPLDALKVRMLLSSVALYIAVAVAAMGFGLFLIGAQGTFKSTPSEKEGSQKEGSLLPAFETTAPGLVLMVCATVIVYLALRGNAPEPPAPAGIIKPATADGGTNP